MRLSQDDQELLGEVSVEKLQAFTLAISSTVRLSGSPGERKAMRYIAAALRRWGYDVEAHRALCWTSWPGAALLEILGEAPESIPCITHSMAAPTPPEGIVLELADVGGAAPADLAARAVTGKAFLCDGLAMPSKAFRVEQAGAAAGIFVCGEHLHEMITSTVWGSPSQDDFPLLPKIPMVSVWQELHDGCVAHVNVDSVGAKGATLLSEAIAMAEVRGVASNAVEKVSGQRLSGARPQRAGDQS